MAEVHELPPLSLAADEVADAARAVIHTVLLCRALGAVAPADAACAALDVAYVRAADPALGAAVDAHAAAAAAWAARRPGRRGELRLALLDRVPLPPPGWRPGRARRACWEEWRLPLAVLAEGEAPEPPATRAARRARAAAALDAALAAAVAAADAAREAVPRPAPGEPTGAPVPFPFEVSLASRDGAAPGAGLGVALRRTWSMLSTAPPPSVLQ
jgi:hypothetical protein